MIPQNNLFANNNYDHLFAEIRPQETPEQMRARVEANWQEIQRQIQEYELQHEIIGLCDQIQDRLEWLPRLSGYPLRAVACADDGYTYRLSVEEVDEEYYRMVFERWIHRPDDEDADYSAYLVNTWPQFEICLAAINRAFLTGDWQWAESCQS